MHDYNALISSEFHEKWANKQHYQHVISKLMYTMKNTRPDLCFVLSKLSQFCLDFSIKHKNVLNDLFQYVNNIVDYVFIFKKKDKIIFECHLNSVYTNDFTNKKSIYETVFFLNSIFCIWYSKKLRSIIISSIETKYMILCQTNKIVVWTTWWLQEFHFLFQKSVYIFFKKNNLKANKLIKNSEHHVCMKHIDVQYYYIKKMIELKIMNVSYVFFFQNAADILIKPLNKMKFNNGLKLLKFTN